MSWSPRLARPEDNEALCALFRDVELEGNPRLALERDPDVFGWARAQEPARVETYVAEDDATGRILGCGTLVVREGRLDGAWHPVGYVADLRMRPEARGARVLPRLGRHALERARDEHGCHVTITAVMEANHRVVATAHSRRAGREAQPVSRPIASYWLACVHRAPRPRRAVERATPSDMDEVAAFLARGQLDRPFGQRIDRKLLEQRFAAWPGFAPSSFLLVRDARGELVGCAAPWDSFALRRSRVRGYSGWLRAAARASRVAPGFALPRVGECFRFSTLSHLEVVDDDPDTLRALLGAAVRERRQHFVAAFVPRATPMERALRGTLTTRVPMRLYTTMLPETPWAGVDLGTQRPGFEMALA